MRRPRHHLRRFPSARAVVFGLLSSLLVAGQAQAQATDPVVAAVGDLGCAPTDRDYNNGNGTATRCRQRYVSDRLVEAGPDAFLALGDNQYGRGELAHFRSVYEPTFGRMNGVVYPILGNAEYDTPGAGGYFDYFASVGVKQRIAQGGGDVSNWESGYYSFEIGKWHIIGLNSNCAEVGGCAEGSPQETWLKRDLAANANRCTLAYWHHPRFNTGTLGNDPATAAFWTALYEANADLVLGGHGNHHYERHAGQNPSGVLDSAKGLRQFIVSTGGESHGIAPVPPRGSTTREVSDYTSFGMLELTLRDLSYDWRFIPEIGGSFTDAGSGTCHAATSQRPAMPTLSATGGDGATYLSWTDSDDGGAPIKGYNVYRRTGDGEETLLAVVENGRAYDDYSAANDTTYEYRVAAFNAVGEGPRSERQSATPAQAPQTSFPVTAVLDDFSRAAGPLGANWATPGLGDSGTVGIWSAGVTRSAPAVGSATWQESTFGADQEAYLAVPALPREGGLVQLAARVNGLAAATLSTYLLRVTPSTSTWDLRRKLAGANSTSMKTFGAPLDAGDSIGLRAQGSTITAYLKPEGRAWRQVGSATNTSITAGGYVAFTLGDATARGGAFGGGTIPASPPQAPTLSGSAGDARVHLSWNAPEGSGAPITGYNVYRGTAPDEQTVLASVGNVTTYEDTTVVNGTTYYYRVSAVSGAGESERSNQITATPTAPVVPGDFPATAVLDDFARDTGTLGGSWQSPGLADPGTVTIAGAGRTRSNGGVSSATWTTSFAADQEAYLTVATLPASGRFIQVALRVSTPNAATVSCYFVRVTPSAGLWELRRKLNGANSTLMRSFTSPFAAGDGVGVRASGSTITAYRKSSSGTWSSVGSTTDDRIPDGGRVSFTLGDATVRGGAVGGGVTP